MNHPGRPHRSSRQPKHRSRAFRDVTASLYIAPVYEGEPHQHGGAQWPRDLDKSCSRYSDTLAIDTSHVSVLVRAARLLAADAPALADRFRDLLRSHTCSGQHRLMSSRTLLTSDTEMNLANPRSAPQLYGHLPTNALD